MGEVSSSDEGRNQKGPQEARPEQRPPGTGGHPRRPSAEALEACSETVVSADQLPGSPGGAQAAPSKYNSQKTDERPKRCLRRSAFRENGALGQPPAAL